MNVHTFQDDMPMASSLTQISLDLYLGRQEDHGLAGVQGKIGKSNTVKNTDP